MTLADIPRLTAIKPSYTYKAFPLRVIDGDTIEMRVDVGFHVEVNLTVRLLGINCPESRGPTREAGIKAKEATEYWFETHSDFIIVTRPDPRSQTDSFRRWLAYVHGNNAAGQQEYLGDFLLGTHNAVPYREGK
jgi:endonuclease YncB( thermonuclease family)